ncbi:MAG TPA: pilin [Candidatus Saccharimonadales bacterium]|nr:pilin [Candidatus Saccharimonadales bacterium]
MIKKIKSFVLIALMTASFSAPALVPVTALAATCTPIAQGISQGINNATIGNNDSSCDTSGSNIDLSNIAKKVVNIFSVIVGIVAVLMIIYGGFRYITSGGESGNISNAKNTLIYALVGLIIVALAQFIVHFVLNTALSAQ